MPIKSPIDGTSTLNLVVKVDGEAIEETASIISIRVNHEVNRISSAEISFADTPNPVEPVLIRDSEVLTTGHAIEIFANYGGGAAVSIFAGLIVKQSLVVNSGSGVVFKLECRHQAVRLVTNRNHAEFADQGDRDIIKSIIEANGLIANVDESLVNYESLVQAGLGDWDFMLSRAAFNGFLVLCDGANRLSVSRPQFTQQPALSLVMGDSVIDFSADWNAEGQVARLEANSWDIDNQEVITAVAEEPAIPLKGGVSVQQLAAALGQDKQSIFNGSALNAPALQVWADGVLLKMRMSAFRGQVSFYGSEIKPGQLILLKGSGKNYDGEVFVSRVSHEISEGNWITVVDFGLENDSAFADSGFNASVQQPGVSGLQVATVCSIASDPKGLFRIQISLNTGDYQSKIWARVSNFYATNGAGAGFLPEIGDEVIVGFMDSDPNSPVVLGALYSSKNAPAHDLSDSNDIKSIVTRSKLKLSFDDGKKVINLTTPGQNTLTLDDAHNQIVLSDQNGNVVTMDVYGIRISSAKSISFNAAEHINLSATGKIEINGKQAVTTKGANISNEADVSFSAKGLASAEVSASGVTNIKGAMVMIN